MIVLCKKSKKSITLHLPAHCLTDAEHVIGRSDVFDRAEPLRGSAILDVEPPAQPNPFQRPGFLIPLRYYFVHRENGLCRFP